MCATFTGGSAGRYREQFRESMTLVSPSAKWVLSVRPISLPYSPLSSGTRSYRLCTIRPSCLRLPAHALYRRRRRPACCEARDRQGGRIVLCSKMLIDGEPAEL